MFDDEGNTDFLISNKSYKMFGEENINSIKTHLAQNNILVRLEN